MTYEYQIVCLANSRKLSGRCVAGKVTEGQDTGSWLRPVGTTETREITEQDREYQDGSTANKLDIIKITFTGTASHTFQRENRVIDNHTYWEKVGCCHVSALAALVDSPISLWENGNNSSSGINDRVSAGLLTQHRQTLYLIRPENVRFSVGAEGAMFGNPKRVVRAHFTYNMENYALIVTDPETERSYKALPDGEYSAEVNYFTISLGEIYQDYAYKLVAAVFM